MNKIDYFTSGNNKLSYICRTPSAKGKETGILFVHAEGGNRLGPHRMFVEMAREFNKLGYPAFRFDLSGCGDSSGTGSRGDVAREVFDTINAICFFQARCELKRVVLFGISRGAKVAFDAVATDNSLPIGGMILLSTPFASRQTAWRNFSSYLREYLCKCRKPKYLLKLIKGKVNFIRIGQTLANAWNIKKRYSDVDINNNNQQCSILLIYGQCDPISKEALDYYTQKCLQNNLPVESHTISQANHSFFHYQWKQQIQTIAKKWLADLEDKQTNA